jgi:ABC-2 type transport system permease protein
MDGGRYTFVIDIPPHFEADLKAGRHPSLQVLADATAMTQAGIGVGYIQAIVSRELLAFSLGPGVTVPNPVGLVTRAKFNPNLESSWFMAVMEIVNNITMLAMFLSGAAIIREREHGTIEHLLVMPLTPTEIMLAKVWANGLVIVIATSFSLRFVVQLLLGLPIAGSIPLFIAGLVMYLFSITALGIFLGTLTRSMPQFALLAMPVFIIMNLLSGGATPQDSMPVALRAVMQLSPSTHFVNFASAILYRGAGFDVVWPDFAASAVIGALFFGAALLRFRKALTE